MTTEQNRQTHWHLNRQINLSVVIELMFLASLIIGSWINLQRQLDILCHDVNRLLQSYEKFDKRYERLTEQAISCRYRLEALEKKNISLTH